MSTPPALAPGSLAPPRPTPWGRRVMVILWPAFLMAGVLEALVFVWVDPAQLRWFGDTSLDLSSTAVHTLAFLLFWGVIATAGALTSLLEQTAAEINRGSALDSPRR